MSALERRSVIVETILAMPNNGDLSYSTDGSIPETATLYVIYDGPRMRGAGVTLAHGRRLAETCKDPIVFFCGGG